MSQCLNPDCLRQNPTSPKFCSSCGTQLLLGDRYRAIKIIGQGGFGRTFLAVDEQKPSKPRCVIKQFFPQAQGTDNTEKAAQLFEQEAVRLDELGHHDQIPALLAYLTQERRQYLVQEFVDGQNLAQELKELSSGFKESQIRELLNDLLPVLEFIHKGQVIHRDIKPENIIRRIRDNKVVLLDFGAAKFATGTALARTGTIIGSAEFLAPEQGRGKAVFASDLYSLGVTCIHLITQISPFDLFDINEDAWVWRQFLVNNPVSDNLGEILDKLIQNAVNKRYKSATEVLQALNPVTSSTGGTSHRVTPPQPNQREFSFEVVTVNRQGKETQRRRQQAQFFGEDLGNGVILEMVSIPGGTFFMGSPDNEAERYSNESPRHQVKLAPFYMGKFPITQAHWRVVAALPQVEIALEADPSNFKDENRPVERVSWHQAVEFCARIKQKTGRNYSLPSEAQWEYACRASTTTPFHFGETVTADLANYDGNYIYGSGPKGKYRKQTTPVGSFQVANSFGLYDMHGNVWEWCADPWHKNYNIAPPDGSVWNMGGDDQYRLLRGGSWFNHPGTCRAARRNWFAPDIGDSYIGFRVVACSVAWTL